MKISSLGTDIYIYSMRMDSRIKVTVAINTTTWKKPQYSL